MGLGEHVAADYVTVGLSLKRHPMALLRAAFERARIAPAARLKELRNNGRVRVAGLVLVRQRPSSASGVIFMTLEDESGIANLVVWPAVFERFRRAVMAGRLIECEGQIAARGRGDPRHRRAPCRPLGAFGPPGARRRDPGREPRFPLIAAPENVRLILA